MNLSHTLCGQGGRTHGRYEAGPVPTLPRTLEVSQPGWRMQDQMAPLLMGKWMMFDSHHACKLRQLLVHRPEDALVPTCAAAYRS
jgi:hypothetical protein